MQVEVGMRGLIEKNVLTYLKIAREFESPILRIVTDTNTFKPLWTGGRSSAHVNTAT